MSLRKATATVTDEQDLSTGDINNIKSALGIDTIESEQITQDEAIALNTAKISFDTTSSTRLANTSGTNTGDQDISGKQDTLVSGTNIKTINGESLLGNGDIAVGGGGVSFGTSGQIPYTNGEGDDLAYSDGLVWDGRLGINTTTPQGQLTVVNGLSNVPTLQVRVKQASQTSNGFEIVEDTTGSVMLRVDKSGNIVGNSYSLKNTLGDFKFVAMANNFSSTIVFGLDTNVCLYKGSQTYIDSASSVYLRPTSQTYINSKLVINNNNATPLATLDVKSHGSTSSTTNLLLRNSSGTELLKVKDSGVLNYPNAPTSAAGLSAGDIWRDGSGQLHIV